MTDRPILFSAPMVRALLDGRKTQTRRILKPQPGPCDHKPWPGPHNEPNWLIEGSEMHCAQCGNGIYLSTHKSGVSGISLRFAIGDRLYVREHWRTESNAYDDLAPSEMDADYPVIFEADADWSTNKTVGRFRQGMHMPRWTSRLTLTVSDVRVERLQAINEQEAIAEGIAWQMIRRPDGSSRARWFGVPHVGRDLDPVTAYADLWDSINGAGSWEANPWVVAVTFTVDRKNIDV